MMSWKSTEKKASPMMRVKIMTKKPIKAPYKARSQD